MKLTIQQFKMYLFKTQDQFEQKRINAVYLRVITKKTAKTVGQVLCVPTGTIYQWSHRYKKFGIKGLLSKPKGGNNPPLMNKNEEKLFLNEITEDSSKGLVVIAKSIKRKLEATLKRSFSQTYLYNFLERNKWRKIAPRPRNPKTKQEDREAFKKDFPEMLKQVSQSFDPADTRPIKLVFQDEARFGRINDLKRCWAPRGIRPHVDYQVIRQFTYVYATVCPKTGETFSLILPDADSRMMNLFLSELKEHYKDYRVIIVEDQASWHKSKTIEKHDNIRFIYLPPASPELNPAENLWDHVREKYFANRSFSSLDELEVKLEGALHEVYHDKPMIQSLTSFSWIN